MRYLNEFSAQQSEINQYVSNFREKSGGYDLGQVEYVEKISRPATDFNDSATSLFFSIPVKNQETGIADIIQSLIENTGFSFSVGILFDNCEDQSEAKFKEFMSELEWEKTNLREVHILRSESDLFEATCENILSLFCNEKYYVSLQADCFLNDSTFLSRCLNAFEMMPELMAISGRAIVPFNQVGRFQLYKDAIHRKILNFIASPSSRYRVLGLPRLTRGYFGDNSKYPQKMMRFTDRELRTLYVGEAVIRGPIVWDYVKFLELSKFNDISFFLGRDDCDLSFRGKNLGFKVGYLPSCSYSISENGTTRKPRSQEAMVHLEQRQNLARHHLGEITKFWNEASHSGRKIFLTKRNRVARIKKIQLS
jgi:hypothetical protein